MALTKIGKEGITGISNSSDATAIIISSDEEVTMPSQPAFLATVNATQTNVTGDLTNYDATGSFYTEVYDKNGDFSNGTFTAPVDGTYYINFIMTISGVSGSTHTNATYTLVSSNRNLTFYHNPAEDRNSSLGGITYVVHSYIDMDANDTVAFRISVGGGSKTVDLFSTSVMSGSLVC